MPSAGRALAETLTPRRSSPAIRWGLCTVLVYQLVVSIWLGWPEPGPGRWWDERFNVLNIESILEIGELVPANAYYGGVSYVPHALLVGGAEHLHESVGRPFPDMLDDEEALAPAGYRFLRITQAVSGAFSVLLVYALARRLTTPGTALLAAALTAVSPRLLHAGAIFKPDVVLLTASLLALLLSWRAASRPSHLGRYLVAGVAVGLATGAKLNGLTMAIPFVLATALRRRQWSRWAKLIAAGVASFATFWIFNPHLDRVLRGLEKNRAHYEWKATGGPLEVLRESLGFLFDPNFHLPAITGAAILGLVLVAAWLVIGSGNPERRLGWWMVVSYPPAYYLVYALASPRAKANHFLQILPFVALFAAVGLATTGRWLLEASGERAWMRRALVGVGILLVLVPAGGGLLRAYDVTTPTTWARARDWVVRSLPEPTRAFRVVTVGRSLTTRSPAAPTFQMLPEVPENREPVVEDADAWILRRDDVATDPVATAFVRRTLDRKPKRTFREKAFRARGETVVAILSPHELVDHPRSGRIVFRRDESGDLVAEIGSGIPRNRGLSFRIRLGIPDHAVPGLRLIVGGRPHDLTLGPPSAGDLFLMSPRFAPPRDRTLRIARDEGALPAEANAELFVWAHPRTPEDHGVSAGRPQR